MGYPSSPVSVSAPYPLHWIYLAYHHIFCSITCLHPRLHSPVLPPLVRAEVMVYTPFAAAGHRLVIFFLFMSL